MTSWAVWCREETMLWAIFAPICSSPSPSCCIPGQFISPSSGFTLGSANGKQWQEPGREEEEARAILPSPGKPASLPVAVPPSPLQPARQPHWVSNFHQVTLSSGPGDPTSSLHSSSLEQWWLPTAVNFHWLHWLLLEPQLLYLLHNHPNVLTSLCSDTGVVSVSSSSPRRHSNSSLLIPNQRVGPVLSDILAWQKPEMRRSWGRFQEFKHHG